LDKREKSIDVREKLQRLLILDLDEKWLYYMLIAVSISFLGLTTKLFIDIVGKAVYIFAMLLSGPTIGNDDTNMKAYFE